ncbi:MAG: D-alanyl-D-alanine carboxypeptidase/D-alanyl-D-alanine-endopeptidase, partial [Phycisphaerae bacterium]|nr:D-alanyl-D-alanine carboxypeptidase/D-alanyl-D-alanine-endopeptidase [Phycisphaerae bacterium]
MMRRRFLHSCLMGWLLLVVGCQPHAFQSPFGPSRARFAEAIREPLHRLDEKGALLAVRVVDVETGQEWYAENPDTPMIPASNGKLAISAAALDLFGPAHTFKTYLVLDPAKDDLWLIGTGDPGCGDERIARKYGRNTLSILDDFTAALKRRGRTEIRGNLYYWDRAFDEEWVHPNWRKDFLVDWYAAPVSGLNFNDNCIDVTAIPGEDGTPAELEVIPPNTIATIRNETVSFGDDPVEILREPDAPVFTVRGGVKDRVKLESKPITNPGMFFADALRTHLRENGIRILGQIQRAESLPFGPAGPPNDRILATHETSIVDVLWRVNKNSQNLFAEALSKAMGREMMFRRGQSVPGSWKLGEEATAGFLWSNRINAGSFVAADGSGLARENRVTARLITDLLVLMYRHPHGRLWRDSLAVAGVDGTLARRLKDIEGRVLAKTGYIGGVRSLSGYVHTRQGRWLAFCMIYNEIDGSVKPYEQLQDDACRVMYYWPGKVIYPPREAPDAATQPAAGPATQASTETPTTQPTGETPATQPADAESITPARTAPAAGL